MSVMTTAHGWRTKVLAAIVAVATIFGMMQLVNTEEASANQGTLRPGCEWDLYNYYVQYCRVWSPSMGKDINVHIKAAPGGSNAGLYLLDGIRARDEYSGWVWGGNAPRALEHANVTMVAPAGGQSSFYTNWQRPAVSTERGVQNYQWETFLTEELPVYLEQEFGVSRSNNAIAGISMGGSAALSLAANHRDQFKQATVLSGYLQTSNIVMQTAIAGAQVNVGGYDPTAMWGPIGIPNEDRLRNDPSKLFDQMQGLPMYISSANGMPSQWSDPAALAADPAQLPPLIDASVLEALSRASTVVFEQQARAAGLDPKMKYSNDGVHSWQLWERDLVEASPQILSSLGV